MSSSDGFPHSQDEPAFDSPYNAPSFEMDTIKIEDDLDDPIQHNKSASSSKYIPMEDDIIQESITKSPEANLPKPSEQITENNTTKSGKSNNDDPKLHLYKRRYWILILYSLFSIHNALIWLTFSPLSYEMKWRAKYRVDSWEIDLLAAWQPFIYLFCVFPVSWFITAKGLRIALIVGAVFQTLGAVMRVFAFDHNLFFLVHFGQILSSFSGPIAQAAPAKLTSTWFGPVERGLATAVASLANPFGCAIVFVVSPYLYKFLGFESMIFYEASLAVLILVCIILYFPDKPPTPPSASSYSVDVQDIELSDESPSKQFTQSMKTLAKDKSFLILCLCGGVTAGVFDGWHSVLSLILPSEPPFNFNDEIIPHSFDEFLRSSSWLGFIASLAGIAGGLLAGPIAGKFHKFKFVIIVLFAAAAVLFLVFTFFVTGIVSSSVVLMFVTCIFASLALNAATPLFYELSVEITYPIPEAVTGGWLSFVTNLSAVFFQAIGFTGVLEANASSMNWILPSLVGAAAVAMFFFKEDHKRLKVDKPECFEEVSQVADVDDAGTEMEVISEGSRGGIDGVDDGVDDVAEVHGGDDKVEMQSL